VASLGVKWICGGVFDDGGLADLRNKGFRIGYVFGSGKG